MKEEDKKPIWRFQTIRCGSKEYLQYYDCEQCFKLCEIRLGMYESLPKECPKKD